MEEFNYDLDRMKIAVNSPTVKLELYRMNREILTSKLTNKRIIMGYFSLTKT
jgi:hypothetical protein